MTENVISFIPGETVILTRKCHYTKWNENQQRLVDYSRDQSDEVKFICLRPYHRQRNMAEVEVRTPVGPEHRMVKLSQLRKKD